MSDARALDKIYACLSDETRRGILLQLSKQEKTVKELAVPFSISLPAISKHLKVLEDAKLVKREVKGRTHMISLDADSLGNAEQFIQELQKFWETKLDNLEIFLNKKEKK